MAKRRLILSAVIVALGLVLVWILFWPALRAAQLSRTLSQTASAEEAARVAADLLRTHPDRGRAVLAEYAAGSDLRAFDASRRILLIHDWSSGKTHIVYVGATHVEPIDTGEPGLDRALAAALPQITAKNFSIGEPPKAFREVRLLETGRPDFVLGPDDKGAYYRVHFEFEGDRLIAQSVHNYDP